MDANKVMEDDNDQLETQNCQDISDSSSSRQQNQNETPPSKEDEVNQFKFLSGNLAGFLLINFLFFQANMYYFQHYCCRWSRKMKIHLLIQQTYLTLSACQLLCMAFHTGTMQHLPLLSVCGHSLHFVALLFPLISFMTPIKGGKTTQP